MFYSLVVFVFLAFGRPLMPDAPEPLYVYGLSHASLSDVQDIREIMVSTCSGPILQHYKGLSYCQMNSKPSAKSTILLHVLLLFDPWRLVPNFVTSIQYKHGQNEE